MRAFVWGETAIRILLWMTFKTVALASILNMTIFYSSIALHTVITHHIVLLMFII